MKISIENMRILFKKFGQEIDMRYFRDINLRSQRFLSGDMVVEQHLNVLEVNKITEVDIVYNEVLYEYLNHALPSVYRKYYSRMSYIEIDRYLEMLQGINTLSHRQRFITFVGDIYGVDPKEPGKQILLSHGEPVDYRKWNLVKRDVDKSKTYPYRNCEVAIIIFVNLTMDSKAEYVEKFKKNMDLISILVSQRCESPHALSPDFIPTEDVISVTNPEELVEVYKNSYARLIIIGENINDDYKAALIKVKAYDKFARMMVVPVIDHRDRDHFYREVKLVYNSDRW